MIMHLRIIANLTVDGMVWSEPDEMHAMLQAIKVAVEYMAVMLQVSGLPLKRFCSIGTSTHSCGSPHEVSKLVKINVHYHSLVSSSRILVFNKRMKDK